MNFHRDILGGEELVIFGIGGAFFLASLLLSLFFGKRRNMAGLWLMGLL